MLDRRKDIDGLRAVAVVPIILMHAGVSGFSGGFVGVDIFFVISGFLITGIIYGEKSADNFSLLQFYERRIRRLFPALALMLIVCLTLAVFLFPPDMFSKLAKSSFATIAISSNIQFYRQALDYFATNSQLNPLLHTWSLGVEEQFFLLFPLIFLTKLTKDKTALLAAIAAITFASFGLSVWMTSTYPIASFYLLPTRAWELGIGSILALSLSRKTKDHKLDELISITGFGLICFSVFCYTKATEFPGAAALLPTIGTAMIIWSGVGSLPVINRLLASTVPVGIGLISYSLYLWHWPVLVFTRLINNTPDLAPSLILFAIAATVALAFLSWKFVERPFRQNQQVGFSRKYIFIGAGIISVLIASISVGIILNNGFPERVPKEVREIYAVASHVSPEEMACTKIQGNSAISSCSLGAPSNESQEQSFLLWGDSHARAARAGVSEFLKSKGLSGAIMSKPGCPPVLGLMRYDFEGGKGCAEFNASVLAMLRERSDLQTIILTARWSVYAGEGRLSDEQRGPIIVRSVSYNGDDRDQRNNIKFLEPAFNETVEAILKMGRKIIIVEGVPEIGWSTPTVIGNSKFFGAAIPKTPDKQNMVDRNAKVSEMLKGHIDSGRIISVSPINFLCEPSCKVIADDRPLYQDSTHLSEFGSLSVMPHLLEPLF